MPFVYSTLANDNLYSGYTPSTENGTPAIARSVLVKGGAGVALGKHMITSAGILTEVSDDDAAFLLANEVFKIHKENGFVVIEDKRHEVDAVVAEMTGRDESAPLVDADFKDDLIPDHAGKTPTPAPAPAPTQHGRGGRR